MSNLSSSSHYSPLSDQQGLYNRKRLFWISYFRKKERNLDLIATFTFWWPPEVAWIQGCFLSLLYALLLTPTVRELCQSQRERGDCEFYVMINGVFKAVVSMAYLIHKPNCSLFPGPINWVLLYYVLLIGEEAFRYLFMRLSFYF